MEKLIEKITDKTDAHISYDKAVLALSKVMAGLMEYKLCKIGDAELPRMLMLVKLADAHIALAKLEHMFLISESEKEQLKGCIEHKLEREAEELGCLEK